MAYLTLLTEISAAFPYSQCPTSARRLSISDIA